MPVHTSLPLPGKLKQIDGLQMLRFVAVLLVVWLHAMQRIAYLTGHVLPNLGIFGVDIFFVISGFIVSAAAGRSKPGLQGAFDYLKRRAIRIYPIFWILGGLFFCWLPLRHGSVEGRFELATLLLTPPLHYPVVVMLMGVAWTLYFEVFFYLVLGAVIIFTAKRSSLAASLILIASVLTGAYLIEIRRPVLFVVANPMLLEFVFGAVIAALYDKFILPKWFGIALVVAGVIAALLLNSSNFGAASGMVPILADRGVFLRVFTWGVAAALIVAGIVFSAWIPKSWPAKATVVLGNASYSTYLVSELVLEYTNRLPLILSRRGAVFTVWQMVFFAAFDVAGVVLVGWLVYQWIEWPLLRYLQARLLPKSRHA